MVDNGGLMLNELNIRPFDIMEEVPALRGFRFDLQRFAAEDEGRTEDPTEKKLREAREKGQVAKTQELPQAVVVIFGFLIIFFFASWIYDSMAAMTKYYMSSFSRFSLTERSILLELYRVTFESAKILLPLFIGVSIAAFLGDMVQVGFQVSTHPLKFDPSKLKFDPATMMRKIFFSKQVAMNLFKSLFKVVVIGFVAYLIIASEYDEILKTPDVSVAMALQITGILALKIILWSAAIMLILAIPDYIFQKREFVDSLKMTKQEMKEEMKETMGDPYLRARLREMQREIVMKNMIREVPKADVVVTNPTHFAVALKYDNDVMTAPMVVAKGVDSMALRIRQIARENEVMLVENRPLAQELYRRLEVGDIIPEDLFYAVTLVYAELYRKRGYQQAI
ncbi:MAG: flagellar biosynthesis protein FlhB [Spirochaetales bacterium]|nr:MAG: flagellar biosynthesis protein FlhB [Spirochaetales bacterium]